MGQSYKGGERWGRAVRAGKGGGTKLQGLGEVGQSRKSGERRWDRAVKAGKGGGTKSQWLGEVGQSYKGWER